MDLFKLGGAEEEQESKEPAEQAGEFDYGQQEKQLEAEKKKAERRLMFENMQVSFEDPYKDLIHIEDDSDLLIMYKLLEVTKQ